VEQLIVGVLLFTPLLGLLPTAAAWHLSVCCCHGALLLLRVLLIGLGRLLRLRALQLLLSRWSEPQRFPGQLMVQPLGLMCSSSSSSSRRGDGMYSSAFLSGGQGEMAAGRSAGAAAAAAGEGDAQQQDAALPVYYQLYSDPLSYANVLKSFLAQQAAGDKALRGSWGASVLGICRAVVRGDTWGVALFCRQ
jgi:hypothetical protein